MTKKFLEINFEQTEQDRLDRFPLEVIRLAVADEIEANRIYDQLDPGIKARPHTTYLHECNHNATGNAPCTRKQMAKMK